MTASGQLALIVEEGDSTRAIDIENVLVLLDYKHPTIEMTFHPGDTLKTIFTSHEMEVDSKIQIKQDLSLAKLKRMLILIGLLRV